MRWLLALLALSAAVAAPEGDAPSPDEPAAAKAAGDPARGALVAGLAGCVSCHTAEGGTPWAGGHAIETTFGTFYGSNLTQDPEHGLGKWTFEDFERAMRQGKGPDKTPYYPAFPYPSFTNLTDADLRDIWAFLETIPPDPRPDQEQGVLSQYASRTVIGIWRRLEFRQGPYEPDAEKSAAWNRGAYLVLGAGHCAECHTPRNNIGGLKEDAWLAGSDAKPQPSPNITPSPAGIGAWSEADIVDFLETGMTPDGDFVGGEMGRIVRDGTAKLPESDRRAIATYLKSLPPLGE